MILWQQTKLGIWYPTMEGRDAFMTLWKVHGLRFGDAPVFEDLEDAILWSKRHGYRVANKLSE